MLRCIESNRNKYQLIESIKFHINDITIREYIGTGGFCPGGILSGGYCPDTEGSTGGHEYWSVRIKKSK